MYLIIYFIILVIYSIYLISYFITLIALFNAQIIHSVLLTHFLYYLLYYYPSPYYNFSTSLILYTSIVIISASTMISHLYDLSTASNNYSSISITTSIPTHLITTFSTSISMIIAHLIYSSTITLIIPIHLVKYLNYVILIINSISTHLV
jgi:hypothetical protein